jgi:hypothetical protein
VDSTAALDTVIRLSDAPNPPPMLERLQLHAKRIYCRRAWKIRAITEDLIPYQPNYTQTILLASMMEQAEREEPIRQTILKFRKPGMSTACQVLFADLCSYNERQTAKLIAHSKPQTREIFEVGRRAIREHFRGTTLPQPVVDTYQIQWPAMDSKILAYTAGSDYVGSGGDPNLLHLSEGPKWRTHNQRKAFVDLMNSLGRTPTSVCIIEFTAVGTELFYNHWRASQQGKTGFRALFFPWFVDRRNVA